MKTAAGRIVKTLAWATVMAAAGLAPAQASIVNGDFSNSFDSADNGWETAGDVSIVVDSAKGKVAQLTTDNNGENAGVNLGVANPAIGHTFGEDLGYQYASYSAWMFQTVSLSAGTKLSFDWRFTTTENGAPQNDFSIALLTGTGPGTIVPLGDVAMVGAGGDSGWRSSTVTLAHSVTTLAFIAGNVGDNDGSSSLYIDNVTAVPEPGTYALMLAGLGLVAVAARRRQA